jgi:hypothetical protein
LKTSHATHWHSCVSRQSELCSERFVINNQLLGQTLSTGRRDLDSHIKQLEEAQAIAEGETATAAENVLDRIKQGLGWQIVVPSKPAPDCAKELEIVRTTLARLDAEMAQADAFVESLGRRILATARRAVYEHGQAWRKTYAAEVEILREMLAQLVALDRLTGNGHEERMVIDLPAFSGPHAVTPVRIEEADIAAAPAVWLRLLSTWTSDPRAEVDLEFPGHDSAKVEQLVYHEMTPTERAIVDCEFAGAAAVQVGSNNSMTDN